MIKRKTIKMLPFLFGLDVWVIPKKDLKKVYKFLQAEYGHNDWNLDSCVHVQTSSDSKCKGGERFIILLQSLNHSIVVHELIHALDFISERVQAGTCAKSTEWRACFYEYLFTEVIKKQEYKAVSE